MVDIDPQAPSFWDEHGAKIIGLIVFALALVGQPDDPVPGALLREGTFLSLAVGFARGFAAMFFHLPEPSGVGWTAPGYAVVLSIFIRAWPAMPDGFALIQLFNSLCLGGAAWGLCAWARSFAFPNHFVDGAVGLAFLSPNVLAMGAAAVPEPMFALITVAAVNVAYRAANDWRAAADGRAAAFAGLLAGLAVASHGLGWATVGGALAAVAGGGRRKVVVFLLGVGVFVVPTLWWSVAGAPTALAVLSLDAAGSADPNQNAAVLLAGTLWNASGPGAIIGGTMALVFFARGLMALWSLNLAAAVTLAAGVFVAVTWPEAPPAWPVIASPFVAFGAAVGARRIWGSDRRLRVPVFLAVGAWVVVVLPGTIRGMTQPDQAAIERRETLHVALSSMRNELPAQAVVASDADVMVFMYTDRHTIPLSGDESVNTLCERGATHLAIMRSADLPEPFASARADSVLLREFDLTDGPSLYRLRCR